MLARLLAAMRRHAARDVMAGRRPDLRMYEPVIVAAVAPLLAQEFAWGAEYARRRIRRAVERRGRRKRKAFAGVTVKFPLAAAAPFIPSPADALSLVWGVFRPEVSAAVQRLALALAGSVIRTATDAVRESVATGLAEGLPVSRIAAGIRDHFGGDRAFTIALSESSRAMHAGQLAAAESAGVVTGKTWLASSDACDLCRSLNGKTVGLHEPFHVHRTGRPEYAVVMHPPGHVNCQCSMLESVE